MSATRRQFLKAGAIAAVAGGSALALRVPLFREKPGAGGSRFAPNQWLRVDADGSVTLIIGKSEMGQGVRTALAMLVAEELEADWKTIALEQASPGPRYDDLGTGGSDSVISGWKPLRTAGAAAREMLIAAAASRWNVAASTCRAEKGAVLHGATGRKLPYGDLVAAAALLPVPKEPKLKESRDFRLIGTRVARIDGPAIVTGRAVYGLDTRVPGMLYAAVARCAVSGGRLKSFDSEKAKAIAGVRDVVPVPNGVAVLAEDTHAALAGRDALSAVWDEGANATLTTDELSRRLDAAATRGGHRSRSEGDPGPALAAAATRLSATYRDAFQAHAPVEPMNTIARVSEGTCEIWSPTQNPQSVQSAAAKRLGIAPEKVTVHVTLIGGGFGRRLGSDYATEAVDVARAANTKQPIQLVWSRREDFLGDFLHPAARMDLAAGLDASGKLVALTHRTTSFHLSMFGPFQPDEVDNPDVSPWGGYDYPYAIPNLEGAHTEVESPIPTGAWRAVEYPPNVFARESFLDEIAAQSGKDPVALRRELLPAGTSFAFATRRIERDPLRAVLELAAQKAGWGTALAAKPGRRAGRGIACNLYHGRTAIAQVAEVSVGAKGDVQVHRIVTAVDCGQPVNLWGLEGQVESGVIWGLSYALKGEITIAAGRVEQTSYADFPVLRLDETPEIETHVVSSGRPPSGLGEMPVPCVAPAVANAIFAATGKRLRRVPIRGAELL